MIVACVALLFALSGTGYAAFKLPGNSVTTTHVKDGTLLARDFKAGQLPAVRWVAAAPCTTSSQAGYNCATGNDPRFVGVYTYESGGTQPVDNAFYVALLG